ncbi:hypothetical protein EB796_022599 [Bugula neritina]|uniref:Uncharacterized protein n=1 Tax=Bugula neritina TaxID=10212 RepID=A0A7J7IYW7_BUGNE|nr:hypothetical protein EB796_022599 [Bugula neritina]
MLKKCIAYSGVLLAVETVLAFSGYLYYKKLKNSQEYRQTLYERNSKILSLYYYVGEKLGQADLKDKDLELWHTASKIEK